jgi:alpha-beta hydrolase superfamily lysophospholipase
VQFANYKFPSEHEDPVEINVKDSDNSSIEYKLKNYRYPPFYDIKNDKELYEQKMRDEFKGVVFYVHGFGEYVGRFAHVA